MLQYGLLQAADESVETLREHIYSIKPSKEIIKLKAAYKSLKDGKHEQARNLASLLQAVESGVSDFANLIVAETYIQGPGKNPALAGKAIPLLLKIEEDTPHSPLIKTLPKELAKAELVLAENYVRAKQPLRAIEFFERAFHRLLGNVGLSQIRPGHLKNYAQLCLKARHNEICAAWLRKFAGLYPRNSGESTAILESNPGILDSVVPAYRWEKITQSYKTQDLDVTAFESAFRLYKNEKYGDAVDALRKFLDEFPRSAYRFRARYWLAQALMHDDDAETATRLHLKLQLDSPLTYYGLMSSIAATFDISKNMAAEIPMASMRDPLLNPAELTRIKRAEEFLSVGLKELASIELRDLIQKNGVSSQFLVYLGMLNNEAGNHSEVFSIFSELLQRGHAGMVSSYALRMIFPLEHLDLIQKYSQEHQIDPVLILSLVKQESGFDDKALSPAGAAGLLQLMPATASDVDSKIERADLTTVETSLKLGVKYLKNQLQRFNGNIVLALAAYNAGPMNAEKWSREISSKRGVIEFIDSIPYRETREYVAAIMRNYYWYSRRLGLEPPKLTDFFWNGGLVASVKPETSRKPAGVKVRKYKKPPHKKKHSAQAVGHK